MKTNNPIQYTELRFRIDHINPKKNQLRQE